MTVHDAQGNPRFCGCPDNAINELQRWPEGRIVDFGVLADSLDDKVTVSEQMGDLDEALTTWAIPSQLSTVPTVTYVDEATADITLAYREGAHGDGQPFDGLGRIVGHAWHPPDGRIHHDNAEVWTPSYRQRVTLHEVGHALGIGHAPSSGNIMYPYVTVQDFLGPWDLAEIVARYGAAPGEPDDPESPTIPPPPMLWGVRRPTITIDGVAPDPGQMIKMWVHDGDSGDRLAESAYFEDDFFLFEIPECRRFSVQATSPVTTDFEGPWNWQSGALVWQPSLDLASRPPREPTEPIWLPWRTAEIVAGELGTQIRFLDTRPPVGETVREGVIARSLEHLSFHSGDRERETHRRLTDRRR